MIESPKDMPDIALLDHFNDLRVAISRATSMRLIDILHTEMKTVKIEIDRRKRKHEATVLSRKRHQKDL